MNDELAILESLGKRFHGADLEQTGQIRGERGFRQLRMSVKNTGCRLLEPIPRKLFFFFK
jgi:hypothetical protein